MTTTSSDPRSTEIKFWYRPHAFLPRSYEILRQTPAGETSVGEYMVLDTEEMPGLTEKKMMNLIALMNGHDELIQLGDHGKSLHFYIVDKAEPSPRCQIMFRERGIEGMTRENAMLLIDREIYNDRRQT